MTPRALLRLPALPALAVLCLLLSGSVLLVTRPSPVAAGLRQVGGGDVSFAVGPRWSRTRPDALLYYADPAGRPVVGLAGAVVADAGYCAGLPTSQRGFAGLAPVVPGHDVAATTSAAAAAWAAGISGRDPPATPHPVATATVLGDGSPAARVHERLRVPRSGDPCVSRRVVLDVVGFAAASGVALFVMVRDVDAAGVGDAEAEAVVQSLRSRT